MLLSKYRKNDSGASATEFALAVPLVVVLFYGMAQFGRILLANAGLRHAIDAGARAKQKTAAPTMIHNQTPNATLTQNFPSRDRRTSDASWSNMPLIGVSMTASTATDSATECVSVKRPSTRSALIAAFDASCVNLQP